VTSLLINTEMARCQSSCQFYESLASLAQFHKRSGNSQHGDFHTSNILCDASSGSFTLIDVADVGNRRIAKRDITYFTETLSLMSVMREFLSEGKRNFEEGYELGN